MKKPLLSTLLALSLTVSVAGGTSAATIQFKDVPTPQSHWAYDTIQWAVEKGVTKGYQDGTFQPNNLITEAEFLAILLNIFPNVKLTNLASSQHWADKFYEHARQYGLPLSEVRNQPITRGYVARLLSGTLGFDYNQNRAIEYLYEMGLSTGKTGKKNIEDFEANANMTRAEAIQFLKNLNDKSSGNPKFVGLKPIEGKYSTFLQSVKEAVHTSGLDVILKAETGDFNIIREYQADFNRKTETIITYTRASNASRYHDFYINSLDTQTVRLATTLLKSIGIPLTNTFQTELTTLSTNGGELKRNYGDYSLTLKSERGQGKVAIQFYVVEKVKSSH